MKLKLNLRRILFDRDMTQTDLMRKSGLSAGTINAIVKGRRRQIDLKTLASLCDTLGVEVGDLIVRDIDGMAETG